MKPVEHLGNEAEVDAYLGPFRDSTNIEQDSCTICAECTIGLKIILDAPDGTPR
jgi:hypothetical protein